jgi:hypothetical protein
MKEYENVDLMIEGDDNFYDGNSIKLLKGGYGLCSPLDGGGQDSVYADINKLLKFLAENEPALYMKFVSSDMMIAHT